jgi:hypothetical protein
LHYKVGTDVDILSYKTTINWSTSNKPQIKEDNDPPRNLTVDWDLRDNPVPYCTWVTITTEFVVPYYNGIRYSDVYFTYPDLVIPFPWFRWEIITPWLDKPDIRNATGGYVVGSFDLIDPKGEQGPTVVGEYRFLHEYDYMQDPEEHMFMLQSLEPMGYFVGNLRLGHAYGYLDPEALWEFNDWMTRIPDMWPLDQTREIPVNWQGQLPYPEGENYLGEFKPPRCTEYLPQDLNKDCCVDGKDFAIFAEAWLQCTTQD